MLIQNRIFLFATASFFAAYLSFVSGCKQPPSPPDLAPGTAIPVNYASFVWKEENDFKRISEYFTNVEDAGVNAVVRTDPKIRAGLYLVVNIQTGTEIPENSVAELRYFRPDKRGENVCTWNLPAFSGAPNAELRLGLTGDAWAQTLSKKQPPAWKLTVTSPAGEKLIERKSFLWEK